MARGVWKNDAVKDKALQDIEQGTLDITTSYINIAQQLVYAAAIRNRPVKVISLGAGVKRIISNTGKCPVCGKEMK